MVFLSVWHLYYWITYFYCKYVTKLTRVFLVDRQMALQKEERIVRKIRSFQFEDAVGVEGHRLQQQQLYTFIEGGVETNTFGCENKQQQAAENLFHTLFQGNLKNVCPSVFFFKGGRKRPKPIEKRNPI